MSATPEEPTVAPVEGEAPKLSKKAEKKAARKAAKAATAPPAPKVERVTWEEFDNGTKLFGELPIIMSTRVDPVQYTPISELTPELAGQLVHVRARAYQVTGKGKICFITLRDRYYTVQAVASLSESVPRELIKFAQGIAKESVIDIQGVVTQVEHPVEKCSQKLVELAITRVYMVNAAEKMLPMNLEDAERPDLDEDAPVPVEHVETEGKKKVAIHVNQDTRLDNRVIDLRVPANMAMFKIQSAVGNLFREFLTNQNFVEIHTPKLIGTASEGGANVFEVKYFGRSAYLAQSPQLYKQMAVMGDLMRVFEIGPVFRAENSNTGRHLTEFVGLDLEMAIKSHYYEVLDLVSELFFFMFEEIPKRYGKELEVISQQYPFEPLKYQRKTLRITFSEGVALLRENGIIISETEDISTDVEKTLGRLVKEKYGTDVYMMDKYPLSARPFYTMPCPEDTRFSNSYDIFIRGQEVSSGAQRIHDPELLESRARALGVPTAPLQDYINSFKYGSFPHGGAGLGLERVAMLYLGLTNVRKVSMFPRDPRRLKP